MADIKSPTLLYAKGWLMLAVGVLAVVLLPECQDRRIARHRRVGLFPGVLLRVLRHRALR